MHIHLHIYIYIYTYTYTYTYTCTETIKNADNDTDRINESMTSMIQISMNISLESGTPLCVFSLLRMDTSKKVDCQDSPVPATGMARCRGRSVLMVPLLLCAFALGAALTWRTSD